jgi:hypothetical protein
MRGNPLRTRADLQRLACDLVEPVLPHFSPGRAQIHLGENRAHYGDPAGWLEAFSRPLWGLVPLGAGGGRFDHWSLWQEGLTAGTDPSHPEFWGVTGDFDQRSVEQAAIGFGLALAPQLLWEPLAPAARDRLAAWLQRINEVRLVQSNWLWFRVLVNLGLSRCGQTWSAQQVEADLAQIDRFYLGDGWYVDGLPGPPHRSGWQGDYYVPMAFHFCGLIYAKLTNTVRFIDRASIFARDFAHWFSADGAALPFGRSLTYRFAQGAFWGALAFADVEALPWPVIKGLYLRHLRWWIRQPVFSETGLLTIGYAYPNLHVAESYNAPGSPYWALKAFLPLALPEQHPFWRAEEAPLPPRRAVHTVPGAKLILVTDPRSREVTAINPGRPVLDWPRHAPHKYSKCAYSTRFGFSVPVSAASPTEGGLDNGLSLSDDGRFFHVREHCVDGEVRDGVAYARWQPWPDVELCTWLVAEPTGHIRLHRLRTARKLWTLEGGFAVGYTDRTTMQSKPGEVHSPQGASVLHDFVGRREAGFVELGANSHLLSPLAAMPTLRSVHEPGEHWLACWAGDNFSDAHRFTVESGGVSRDGEEWWTRQDGSSAARLRTLEELA